MSIGILHCFVQKKKMGGGGRENTKNPKSPIETRQLLLLENSFTFLRVDNCWNKTAAKRSRTCQTL